MSGLRTRCLTCGRDYAVRADGRIRDHSCDLTKRVGPSPRTILAAERRRIIVDTYNAAPKDAKPTLQDLADLVGVSRERARQLLAGYGVSTRPGRRAMTVGRQLERQCERLVDAMRDAMTRPPCKVCGAWVIRRRGGVTCSEECARRWIVERYIIDAEAHTRHRLSVARGYLRHPATRTPSQIAWAHRMLSDNPPPPNRRFAVTKKEAFARRHEATR